MGYLFKKKWKEKKPGRSLKVKPDGLITDTYGLGRLFDFKGG
jgi:hypothetical protein